MKIFTIIFLTAIFAVSAVSQTSLKIGATAPAFSGTSLDGTDYSLDELRGSVVVMTFWSTKCEICHVEFPKLNRVIKSFDGKKVVFLSFTMENEVKVEAPVAPEFPVAPESPDRPVDPEAPDAPVKPDELTMGV